jgi:hypothetical protein
MKTAVVAGWLSWSAVVFVVFGVFNLGLSHERLKEVESSLDQGGSVSVCDAVRAYVTNDGDLRRYFAYTQAALGRPYQSYYVRTGPAWRQAFASGEPYRPDQWPVVTSAGALVPYRDFAVEYPPGFFLMALPLGWLFRTAGSFGLAFQSLMAFALSAALCLTARTVRVVSRRSVAENVPAWGALAALLLGVVTTHRFDAAVALALALAAWALVTEKPFVVGVAAGVAAALKGVPLVALPPLLLYWLEARRFRALTTAATSAVITSALLVGPVLAVAGGGALETVRYHANRPLQIESSWGAWLGLLHTVRPALILVEKTYGSTNVVGGPSVALARLSTLTAVMALALVYAATWRRLAAPTAEARKRAALVGMMVSLVVLVALGKVGSPQYLVWLLPLGVGLSLAGTRRSPLALFLAASLLTQIVYPIGYGAVESLRPWALGLVLLRHGLLLAWSHALLRFEWPSGERSFAPISERIAEG